MKEPVFELCDKIRETSLALHAYLRHGQLEKVYENGLAHPNWRSVNMCFLNNNFGAFCASLRPKNAIASSTFDRAEDTDQQERAKSASDRDRQF